MSSMFQSAAVLAAVIFSFYTSTTWAQASACHDGWSFENITSFSSNPSVAGTPSTFSWYQSNVGKRDEIYARNNAGDLIHYFRIGRGPWQGENLSITTNGPSFRTDPVAVHGFQEINNKHYNRHDIYAVDANDNLIHYWWSEIPPSGWHSENLTTSRNGPKVWGKPIVWNSYYYVGYERWLKIDVYSIDVRGDLIHYGWTRIQGWRHDNVTQNIGGAQFQRDYLPSIVDEKPFPTSSGPSYHHLFGINTNGHLLHYWREPQGWRWENLTLVNGMQTHPTIVSGTGATAVNGRMNSITRPRYSVFGFLGSDMIRYWSWNLAKPWNSENVTATFGFNGSSGAIIGRPAVVRSRQLRAGQTTPTTTSDVFVRHDLYARDSHNHLIHYWSSDPWPSFKASNGVIPWQRGENLTTRIDGIYDGIHIGTDPLVLIRHISGNLTDNPEHYVFGRIGNRLVNYCWNRSNGWTSGTLQLMSNPWGEDVSEDPALTPSSTVGISVYAAGLDGDLLHFWKP